MNTSADSLASAPPQKSRLKLWLIGFVLLAAGGAAVYYWGTGKPAESSQQGFRGPGFGRSA